MIREGAREFASQADVWGPFPDFKDVAMKPLRQIMAFVFL